MFGKKQRPALPTVRFDRTRVTEKVRADLWAAIQEYEDLPLGKETAIFAAALEGVSRDRDLSLVVKTMTDCEMLQQRAGDVALHLTNRAMSPMEADRMTSLEITKARWLWSGACRVEGHLTANGKTYVPQSGLRIKGVARLPGQEPGCSCVGIAIVLGFD